MARKTLKIPRGYLPSVKGQVKPGETFWREEALKLLTPEQAKKKKKKKKYNA